mmetsp:Transcript_20105/g.45682  ORF Transcript_20105/g.45682 Transcript_20105/m.45682 type:complete len:404 (-) Transcript_20105:529-1740(-)
MPPVNAHASSPFAVAAAAAIAIAAAAPTAAAAPVVPAAAPPLRVSLLVRVLLRVFVRLGRLLRLQQLLLVCESGAAAAREGGLHRRLARICQGPLLGHELPTELGPERGVRRRYWSHHLRQFGELVRRKLDLGCVCARRPEVKHLHERRVLPSQRNQALRQEEQLWQWQVGRPVHCLRGHRLQELLAGGHAAEGQRHLDELGVRHARQLWEERLCRAAVQIRHAGPICTGLRLAEGEQELGHVVHAPRRQRGCRGCSDDAQHGLRNGSGLGGGRGKPQQGLPRKPFEHRRRHLAKEGAKGLHVVAVALLAQARDGRRDDVKGSRLAQQADGLEADRAQPLLLDHGGRGLAELLQSVDPLRGDLRIHLLAPELDDPAVEVHQHPQRGALLVERAGDRRDHLGLR